MKYIISGDYEEVLSDFSKIKTVLPMFFVGALVLSEGISTALILFPLAYFLCLAVFTRVNVFTYRANVHKVIISRLILSLLFSLLAFIVSFSILIAKNSGLGSETSLAILLRMEILLVLLFALGAVGVYGDWRVSRLSAAQLLFVGAIGWAFYLLLWRIALSVNL